MKIIDISNLLIFLEKPIEIMESDHSDGIYYSYNDIPKEILNEQIDEIKIDSDYVFIWLWFDIRIRIRELLGFE